MINVIGCAAGRFLEHIFAALFHDGSDKLSAAVRVRLRLILRLRWLSLIGSLLIGLRLCRRRLAVGWLLRLRRRLLWVVATLRVQQTAPGNHREKSCDGSNERKRLKPFSHKILLRRGARVPLAAANQMPKNRRILTTASDRRVASFYLNRLGTEGSRSHPSRFGIFLSGIHGRLYRSERVSRICRLGSEQDLLTSCGLRVNRTQIFQQCYFFCAY
jgi:hypothetical protein